jgi:hypothetical protein
MNVKHKFIILIKIPAFDSGAVPRPAFLFIITYQTPELNFSRGGSGAAGCRIS